MVPQGFQGFGVDYFGLNLCIYSPLKRVDAFTTAHHIVRILVFIDHLNVKIPLIESPVHAQRCVSDAHARNTIRTSEI